MEACGTEPFIFANELAVGAINVDGPEGRFDVRGETTLFVPTLLLLSFLICPVPPDALRGTTELLFEAILDWPPEGTLCPSANDGIGDLVLADPSGAVFACRCVVDVPLVDRTREVCAGGLEVGCPRPTPVLKGGLEAGSLVAVAVEGCLTRVLGLGMLEAELLDFDPPAPMFQTLRTRFFAEDKKPKREGLATMSQLAPYTQNPNSLYE